MKRLLLIIACILGLSHSAFADTFGNSGGANDGAGAANNPTCSKFTPASSGTITKMTARFNATGTGNFRTAIYHDTAGVPSTFMAQSSSDVLVTGVGDYDSTISASIVGGTPYWLCIMADTSTDIAIVFTTGSSGDGSQEVGIYPTFPSPYGVDFPNSNLYRIWATYTPSGGGATCNGGLMLLGAGGC